MEKDSDNVEQSVWQYAVSVEGELDEAGLGSRFREVLSQWMELEERAGAAGDLDHIASEMYGRLQATNAELLARRAQALHKRTRLLTVDTLELEAEQRQEIGEAEQRRRRFVAMANKYGIRYDPMLWSTAARRRVHAIEKSSIALQVKAFDSELKGIDIRRRELRWNLIVLGLFAHFWWFCWTLCVLTIAVNAMVFVAKKELELQTLFWSIGLAVMPAVAKYLVVDTLLSRRKRAVLNRLVIRAIRVWASVQTHIILQDYAEWKAAKLGAEAARLVLAGRPTEEINALLSHSAS